MTPDTGRAVWLVSDVDGTLLDDRHQLPIAPAQLRRHLASLAEALATPITVVLASSRTLRELLVLQRAWGMPGPVIAEDGGVVAWDAPPPPGVVPQRLPQGGWRAAGRRTVAAQTLAPPRAALRQVMAQWPAVARAEAGGLPTVELAARGIASVGAVRRAVHHRETTALLAPEWLPPADMEALAPRLAGAGLVLRHGGRWSTLSGAPGKGEALARLRQLVPNAPVHPVVVAVGNHANDAPLLAVADLPFAINNPGAGHHPALAAIPAVVRLRAAGPAGWIEMLGMLRERLPSLLPGPHA